ncbi:uncharacterized protein BDW47DRAFT_124534 [Aspergillus candidus]|uniref:Uncharacterized protein n=1 Tax=Aspergillus candidus TaxID=41067 RepID=A0A2I2FG01_ASPCN|nr:hypothetical protein BDW47DRAFT_124534 [Aspergillus candidus]PLB39541.1 hypothetical protein BDW47DRAFT_124534 [Aspergillus candidus]
MSSDDAYMSFLDKANADLNNARAERAQRQSIARTEAVDIDVRVPTPLTSVDAYYVSETDEPFEPVTLKWEKAVKGIWPDPTNLSNLISPTTDLSSSISTLSPSAFDPHNQYATVLRAVRAAAVQAPSSEAGGAPHQSTVDVKVYRVEVGASRVEYWLLALNIEESLLVGLRVKAVES